MSGRQPNSSASMSSYRAGPIATGPAPPIRHAPPIGPAPATSSPASISRSPSSQSQSQYAPRSGPLGISGPGSVPGPQSRLPQLPQTLPQTLPTTGFPFMLSSSSSSSSSSLSSLLPPRTSTEGKGEGKGEGKREESRGPGGPPLPKKPRTETPAAFTLTDAQLDAMTDDEQLSWAIETSRVVRENIKDKTVVPSDTLATEATKDAKGCTIEFVICYQDRIVGNIPAEKCENCDMFTSLIDSAKVYKSKIPANSTIFILMSQYNEEQQPEAVKNLISLLSTTVTTTSKTKTPVNIINLNDPRFDIPGKGKDKEDEKDEKRKTSNKRKREVFEETIEEKDKRHFYYLAVPGPRATLRALEKFHQIMNDHRIIIPANKAPVKAPLISNDFKKALGDGQHAEHAERLAIYMETLAKGTQQTPIPNTLDLWSFLSAMNWLAAHYLLTVAAAKIAHLMRDVPNDKLFEVFFGQEMAAEFAAKGAAAKGAAAQGAKDGKEKDKKEKDPKPGGLGKGQEKRGSTSTTSTLSPWASSSATSSISSSSTSLISSSSTSTRPRGRKRNRDREEGEGEGE